MESEGDERGRVEGEFRTAQAPFEAFAVLTHVEFKRERGKKLKGEKGK